MNRKKTERFYREGTLAVRHHRSSRRVAVARTTIPRPEGPDSRRSRKRPIHYGERRYHDHWRIEAVFCRLKDFRRVATRYHKLAGNFLSAVCLAAIISFGI